MSESLMQEVMRLSRAGKVAEAAAMLEPVVTREPENFDALHALAVLRAQQGATGSAEQLLAQALTLRPDSAELLYNRGALLQRLGRNDEALSSFSAALAVRADYPEALVNRGVVLGELGRLEEALADFATLTVARPALPNAWSNHGTALMKLKRYREALASYNKAIALKSDYVEARRARASLHFQMRQFAEALSDITWILGRHPDDAAAWQLRGDIVAESGRRELAVESYGRAIALRPDSIDAIYNRAHHLSALARYDEAARDYGAVVGLDPQYGFALGHFVFAKLCCCDWRNLESLRAQLRSGLRDGSAKLQPFHALVLAETEADIFAATRAFAASQFPATGAAPVHRANAHDRIRIGYISANFCNHAVARQMAGVFEHHDRWRFEITAFSLGPDDGGELRKRLVPAFDTFVDLRSADDERIAQEIRRRQIDLLVDLMGFTESSRPGIAAHRSAPVQAGFVGYPGTSGSDFMDYLIADPTVIPAGSDPCYSEKIIRLPHCYLPQDRSRAAADDKVSRAAAGLPEQGIVFCCFNHSYKIGPEIFDVWMRLLRNVPGSVLWLNKTHVSAQRNLLEAARARDVAPERIVFAPVVASDSGHLARLKAADLFLDTPGYNAHATASDALAAGLPVLTIMGDRFAARVGASLLRALGMDELIAGDLSEYEQLALGFARDPSRLAATRSRLAQNARTQPLFDTAKFTRQLETAYQMMVERNRQGLQPAAFAVDAQA
ncbi:MAG TPA: tetratricopeptide repeat protein [Micropepsaceae bacterium]|nr:tetratricopeptide repeat protein [Micropepsaceae bacterium]